MNSAWQRLANLYNLTFVPDHFPHEREHVVGEYRGYQLQLSHWTFGTEIILSANAKVEAFDDKPAYSGSFI